MTKNTKTQKMQKTKTSVFVQNRKKKEMEIKSVSLKIEPLQYIAIYYNGSIFNETDFTIF